MPETSLALEERTFGREPSDSEATEGRGFFPEFWIKLRSISCCVGFVPPVGLLQQPCREGWRAA